MSPRLRGSTFPIIIQDLLDEIELSGRKDKDILRAANVSINTLTNIRAGRRLPSIKTLVKIADALNTIPRLISKEPSDG